jgi:hypothetical protein
VAAPWRGGRKYITQPGLKKSCEKLKCNAVKMTLGSREKGLLGEEDTKRGSERKHAKVSGC